jgi:hypothetical protein
MARAARPGGSRRTRLRLRLALASALALLLSSAAGRAQPESSPPAPDELARLLRSADEADLRLRVEGTCAEADLETLRRAMAALAGSTAGAPAAWRFPIRGIAPARSIGGRGGDGYRAAHPHRCFAIENPGHPAQDLFVDDPEQDGSGGAHGPWVVQAVEDGPVLVARTGWKVGDALKGGNYVVQLLPARGALAYYAHLATVGVRAGEMLIAGDALGTVGRTGKNAWPKRSPTHLHFALWDARTLWPMNPYRLLASRPSRSP